MASPQLGIYVTCEGAVGILAERTTEGKQSGKVQIADAAKTKELFFQVTHPAGGNHEFWFASLVPIGKDPMWRLEGHPKGGLLLLEGDTLKECDYRNNVRMTWSFHKPLTNGKCFAEKISPPTSKYPTENFRRALVQKDSHQNDASSLDTQAIVNRYCPDYRDQYASYLPGDPIKRQKDLVKIYTMESDLYPKMNQALRDDDLDKMKLFAPYIKELRDVFLTDHEDQIITPFKGTVWRGIHVPDLQKELQKYQLNNIFVWEAFTSTSTDKKMAMTFMDPNMVFEIRCNPPEGLYDDDSAEYAPADISQFSEFDTEAEILFPPNVEFKVVEVKMPGGSSNIDKPLIICDTMAFDSSEGLHEFVRDSHGKQTNSTSDGTTKTRLGIYSNDGNALAALSIQFGKTGAVPKTRRRNSITSRARGGNEKRVTTLGTKKVAVMSITHTGNTVDEFWSSHLTALGRDDKGRRMWALKGHPQGGRLIHNGVQLLEFDEADLNKPRHVWTFRPDLEGQMYSVMCKAPVRHDEKYPTENFVACVTKKDPRLDDHDAPDTQTIAKKYGEYEDTLPKDPKERRKVLIRLYTDETPLYHQMNAALRDDDFTKMKIFGAFIKELQQAFLTDQSNQILTPFRGTVWRGITVPDLGKALKEYQPNKDVVWEAFTSTTTNKDVAFKFGNIVFEIKCDPPDGFYEDKLFEYAPANIQAFSIYSDEEEILFPPNVKFRVTTVQMPSAKNGLPCPLVMCECAAFEGVDSQLHAPRFCELAFDMDDAESNVSPTENDADRMSRLSSPSLLQDHYIPGKDTQRPVARNLAMLELEMSFSSGMPNPESISRSSMVVPETSPDAKPRGFCGFDLDFLNSTHGSSGAPKTMPALRSNAGSVAGSSMASSVSRKKVRRKTAPASKPLALNIRAVESTEDVALIHRVTVMLSNPSARSKQALAAFDKSATSVEILGKVDKKLPISQLCDVLRDMEIPDKHASVFRGVIRRAYGNLDLDAISFEQFQEVLVKSLRRVRDMYCARLSRDQLVTRRTGALEEDYMQLAPCGSGSFGQCSWVVHKVTRKIRVVKKINKDRIEMPKEEIEQELDTLKMLDHPHIVRLFEWFEQGNSFYLVMEAAHGGDLDKLLRQARTEKRPGLDEKTVLILCRQALGALVYIHSQNVIHRDLKPANMILTEADRLIPHLLLADFGIADIFGTGELSAGPVATKKKGTWAYMAPEIFNDIVSPKSDLWALGVVVYELLCGKRPFGMGAFEVHAALFDDAEVDLSPVKEVGASDAGISFLQSLLAKDSSDRPNGAEAEIEIREWQAIVNPTDTAEELARARRSVRPSLTKAMTGFKEKSTFSKMALLCIASQLDTSMLEDLNEMFSDLDKDHDGQLSVVEFVDGFRQLGVSEDDIEAMVDSLDINCSGHVEYSEFIAGCLGARTELVDTTLFHAFNVFDINHDGVITIDELRTILGSDGAYSGILPDGKSLEDEFAEIDTSHDGKISYSEFRAHLEKDAGQGNLVHFASKIEAATSPGCAATSPGPPPVRVATADVSVPSLARPSASGEIDQLGYPAASPSATRQNFQIRELAGRAHQVINQHQSALMECSSVVDAWIRRLNTTRDVQRRFGEGRAVFTGQSESSRSHNDLQRQSYFS